MGVYTVTEIQTKITTLTGLITNIQERINTLVTEGALPFKSLSQSADPAKMIDALNKTLSEYRRELRAWEKELRMLQNTGPINTRVYGTSSF